MSAKYTQSLRPYHKWTAAGDLYARSNLTRMQMLYWTGQQLRPEAPLYAAPLSFIISGELDTQLFCQAVQAVVDQSDALRTIIKVVDSVPQQVVQPQLAAPIQLHDFSGEAAPFAAAKAWLQQLAATPLDLQKSPYRFALAEVSPEKRIWLMCQHHIIADATSSFNIYQFVARLYEQLLSGHSSDQVPTITPFQIYLEYEREYRESNHFQRAKRYWQQRLIEDVEPLNFFGRPSVKKITNTQRLVIELDNDRKAKLIALTEQEQFRDLTQELTMFNVLASLFFALVHHLSNTRRLTFLTPIHNRPTQAFRQTIGLLMELCPFVATIEDNETPASLILQLKRQTRGVMRFSQYGSSISLKNKAHDLMFNYHRRPLFTFNGQPVEQELLHSGHSSDSFALHIHEFEGSGVLKLKFDFHNDIFTEEERETTIQLFYALLDAFATDIDQPLAEIVLPWSAVQTAVSPAKASQRSAKTDYIPPRDQLELDLKNLWEAVLGVPRIGIYDNFFDLGGTSWQAMNLFADIEKLTGHYLPLATLVQAGTIADLAEELRQQSGTEAWPTLVKIQEGAPTRQPLYLVHGGGGHVLIFTKLARHLPTEQPVYAFQAQGLDGKSRPLQSIEEMAAHYAEALLSHQPEGPFQLAGYSMGGAVAFEMAQQLQARGHQVTFVGIIDTPAQHPNLKWVRLATKLTTRLFRLSPEEEQRLFIKNRHRFWVGFRQLMANQISRLTKRANRQKMGSTSAHQAQEDVRVQKITMNNNRVYFCYVPKRYPGQVTLFKSTKGYRDIYRDTKDPLMGWQRITNGVDVHLLDGNHNQIMDEPNVQVLAAAFMSALER